MYYRNDQDQLSLEEFSLPFGGRLLRDNRWVRLAGILPWEYIEEIYAQNMSDETGRPAISSRIAFGAIFIKEYCHITDKDTVTNLQENSYMQYFVGLHEFHPEPLFDPSMMVHFRKRFPVEEVAKINEYVCTGKWPEEPRNVDRNDHSEDGDEPPCAGGGTGSKPSAQKGKANPNTSKKKKARRKKNRGKLILDATVAPADIKYPTDIDLLNRSREHLETAVDILWPHVSHTSHKLPYSAKKARKSYLKLAKSKKWTRANCRRAIGEQLRYIELASKQLRELSSQIPNHETLFPRWLRDRLAVIPVVYRQQKMMYDNYTHICEDRIVSLEQPHVRPIQRGKRPNPTEFGQNCTFPWWMDTPIWSRPAGAASTKALTLKPLWKIIFGNSAAIPAQFWRTESTRPAAIRCSVPSLASGCPAHPWVAGKPLRQTPKSSAKSIGMPVSATPLRDETPTRNAALVLTDYSLNWMKRQRPRLLSSSWP